MPLPKKAPPARPSVEDAAPVSAGAFAVEAWEGHDEGEKIILYGPSGIGKTTLAAMLPDPVFIGIDDGGRKVRRPDGTAIDRITGIKTYEDLKNALSQPDLWAGCQTIVLDTLTKIETTLAQEHLIATRRTEKGQKVDSIEGYGWGKGWIYLQETLREMMPLLDSLVASGKNICCICQESAITVPNAGGMDFLQAGPKLVQNRQASARTEWCEWADHVFRVGFYETAVIAVEGAKVGKIASMDATRVVYVTGAQHLFAKSRTLSTEVVAFEDKTDDSVWQLMLGDAE